MKTSGKMGLYNKGFIRTRAVLPIAREATETEAGMTANCVDTL